MATDKPVLRKWYRTMGRKPIYTCFNFEVQSEHFGNSHSLSIKGSSVETLNGGNVELTFHSHFSDESRQDSYTTNAHMGVLV